MLPPYQMLRVGMFKSLYALCDNGLRYIATSTNRLILFQSFSFFSYPILRLGILTESFLEISRGDSTWACQEHSPCPVGNAAGDVVNYSPAALCLAFARYKEQKWKP